MESLRSLFPSGTDLTFRTSVVGLDARSEAEGYVNVHYVVYITVYASTKRWLIRKVITVWLTRDRYFSLYDNGRPLSLCGRYHRPKHIRSYYCNSYACNESVFMRQHCTYYGVEHHDGYELFCY